VNGGTLEIDGSISSSRLTTVNDGARLTGTGTVGDTQINSGGIFIPGTAGVPGTSTDVAGTLTFQPGSVYAIFLNSLASTTTNVTGNANLHGQVVADFTSDISIARSYNILHSAGLKGTTFDSLQTVNLGAGFHADLSYTSTDIYLNLTAQLGLGMQLLANPQVIVPQLNEFFNSGGALPRNFVTLFRLTGSDLANALMLLDGEVGTGAERAAFQLMNEFFGAMLDPYVGGRAGDDGGNATPYAAEKTHEFPDDVARAYAAVFKTPAAQRDRRWSLWAASYGGSSMAKGDTLTTGSSNVTARTFGFSSGVDYRLSADAVLGFALAGGGTNWGLSQGLGSGRGDAFQAGLYGRTRSGPAYLAGALAFTDHWMATNRTAFLGDKLSASFSAQSYGGRLESGYRFAVWPGLGVAPYAGLQAQSFLAPSYGETDLSGAGFALSFGSRTASDIRSELGAQFDEYTGFAGTPLRLRSRVAWAHDWVSTSSLTAAFQTLANTSFVVNGAPYPHNLLLSSFGGEWRINSGLTVLAKFDGEFAQRAQTYAGSTTIRFTW
jgi:outer membrane autotransporter protein